MKRYGFTLGAAALIASLLGVAEADVTPPQGYIGLDNTFSKGGATTGQNGFYNLDFGLKITTTPIDTLSSTFWSNQFTFYNSAAALPANHVGGDQGGYLGVQVKSATEQIAIFSVWWATEAKPGPGATCVDAVEMWYNDDKPFEPAITDPDKTDPKRKVAGGPYRSCRLPVTLTPGTKYRLRVYEIRDANKPDDPEWWGAWLIDDATGKEQMIGQVKVPGVWGWLNKGVGGFMERFADMPNGCDSIPASETVFYPAVADKGAVTASLGTHVYGACEDAVKKRYTATTAKDGSVTVVVK